VATETVYVELLDEGTVTYRPVDAEPLGDGRFRLIATSDYDPEDETWGFLPGAVVRCAWRYDLGETQVLCAYEEVTSPGPASQS
jgi:hypothetical protein